MTKKDINWHNISKEDCLEKLSSSKEGLSEKEAEKRLKEYGPNVIKDKNKFSVLKLFFSKFNSLLIYILIITAVITYYLDQMIEFYSIIIVIGFSVILGFIHEYRAEKSVQALSNLTTKKVEVIRDSQRQFISANDLVPGDIIMLKTGLIVPADVRLVSSESLSADESILTGESVPRQKSIKVLTEKEVALADRSNMVFSGTTITSGKGIGVVVFTGFKSEIGKISKTLSTIKKDKTPLQKKMDVMSGRISYTVIMLSILGLIILLHRGEDLVATLILIAALAIAGIPEEFPLALTMALSAGIKKMARKNAIIKDMGSVETLGTTTVICTDKTGTLTQNKMMVVKFNSGFKDYEVKGDLFNSKILNLKGKDAKRFFETAVLCSNAELHKVKGENTLFGDPTEGALLGIGRSYGFNEVKLRDKYTRLLEEPFDSTKKFMVTVHKVNNKKVAYLKGAVEKVLAKVSHIRIGKKVVPITKKHKDKILETVHSYSNEALRVLALASKEIKIKSSDKKDLEKQIKKGFVFEGVVGIQDPIRPEVYDSITECFTAGIRIIMVTGDHKNTARAIGEKLGLITTDKNIVMEGKELDLISDDELDKKIQNISIFARATPEHKLRIVSSLQRLGEIVAMTGDGINDAPALKKADIGVSMGKEGTDVAREASNMVLTDDAFSSIVEAVREGRTIYSNIKRFSYFLISVNAAEVGLILLAILLDFITPLTALMILFINVIISSLPALGLSIENTNPKVMHNLPRSPKERILSNYILLKMFIVVPVMIGAALTLFFWELNNSGDVNRARTFAFMAIIVGELLHAFNARSLHRTIFTKRTLSNKYFFAGMILAIVLVMFSIYNPWFSTLLGTASLSLLDWGKIILVTLPVLLVPEFIKIVIQSELNEQKSERGVEFKIE